ncbi:MAG: hypothetical protein NPINA01_19790 [Nitrospinaceae bacterium]|nr:MAG: hypothetical protein NPINA01_19790 [Nitrospinaceae bacterium]
MTHYRAVAAFFLLFAVLVSATAEAGMYSWTDDKGAIHFTDDVHKIPEEYRQGDKRFKKYRSARPPSSLPLLEKPVPSSYSPGISGAREYVVPMISTDSGNFLVEVTFNNRVKANLMVDTGASLVTISGRLAKKLGYRFGSKAPQIPFTTAGGVVWMPMLALDNVKIGGAGVDLVEASVNDHLGEIDGLLGMSFLGDFRMEMDKSRSQMILRPIGNPSDRQWAGKPGLWWETRFSGYVRKIKDFQAEAKTMQQSGHPMAGNIERMVGFYEDLHSKLDQVASRAGVPMLHRSYP